MSVYKMRKPRPGFRFYVHQNVRGRPNPGAHKYIHVVKVTPKLIVTEEYDINDSRVTYVYPLPENIGKPNRVVEYKNAADFFNKHRNIGWGSRVVYLDDVAPLEHLYPALRGEAEPSIDLNS